MNPKIHEETLQCGGRLRITDNSWEISYNFHDPSFSNSNVTLTIPGRSINQYIFALHENWIEYETLKSLVPLGEELTKEAKMGMSIRIGNFSQGVCILSHHMAVNTKKQLDEIINGYFYAEDKAQKFQTPSRNPKPINNPVITNNSVEKSFQDLLFEARREWIADNHSNDNLWALWKFDQAIGLSNPNCGTFDYWFSISNGGTYIESMVSWAEAALRKKNLNRNSSASLQGLEDNSNEKTFQGILFEGHREWTAGNHSNENIWALWIFSKAKLIDNPDCGSFESWSLKNSEGSQINCMVSWAEAALEGKRGCKKRTV